MTLTISQLKNKIAKEPRDRGGKIRFSKDLRSQILNFIAKSDYSQSSICKELGISMTTVSGWHKSREKINCDLGAEHFTPITVSDKQTDLLEDDDIMEIISPYGFHLRSSSKNILALWREIHA